MRCAIWYHLYNLENAKNTHGGVLLLVQLQALAKNFSTRNKQMIQLQSQIAEEKSPWLRKNHGKILKNEKQF